MSISLIMHMNTIRCGKVSHCLIRPLSDLNEGEVVHNILEDPFRRRTREFVEVALVVLAVEIGDFLDPRHKQKLFPLLCRLLRRFCHLAFSHSEHAVAEDVDLALMAFHLTR